ncbi:APC family permease [Acidithiobacillus ferriphilus]|uniref:APC family permease n=1 Tax=Acidithiobacillus ferriphilus TaxID=1689834 RepID=UPI003F5193CB
MAAGHLRREGGTIGLLYASLGAIVGSGWLFGPLHAAQQAGPLSLGSWAVGAVAILLLALVYAELGPMIPRSGSIVHISHLGNGPLLGRIWSWVLFFSYVSIAPVEVTAVLTYANNYLPGFLAGEAGVLSDRGFVVAILLLGVFVLLNFLVIRWVLLLNSAATWWKLIIPAATIFVLLSFSWHPENLQLHHSQGDLEGMFTAVASAGIIFSFFGFRQAIDLAGESRNPGRSIPIAVIGSVLIGTMLYEGLQFAFLMAVNPADLAHGGWSHLAFAGLTGPFAALAAAVGAAWWGVILYVDALVSPAGTAFIYTTSSARITMAVGEMGSAPRGLARINDRGVPWIALLTVYAVGALFFFPFPSWQKLVGYISSVTVLSYSLGPIVLLQLRRAMPDAVRPFRLRGAEILAPAAFVVANWIIFWAGLDTLSFTFSALIILMVVFLVYHYVLAKERRAQSLGWRYAWWVLPYFAGLWICSYLGPQNLGGRGLLPFFWDMAVLAAFSLVILFVALRTTVADQVMRDYVESLNAVPEAAP